jgi:hypothetical protein
MAERDAAEKKNRKQYCEDEKDSVMNFTERLDHRCGFLSSGGSGFPPIHRRRSKGQKAAQPGKISSRKPRLLPTAWASTRFTPMATKASEKTNPMHA